MELLATAQHYLYLTLVSQTHVEKSRALLAWNTHCVRFLVVSDIDRLNLAVWEHTARILKVVSREPWSLAERV
jgi:hypothetical protein